MSDILERLRTIPRSGLPIGLTWNACDDAADEIERLRAALNTFIAAVPKDCVLVSRVATEQMDARIVAFETETEKLRAALKQARRDALEEAMEIAFKERFCVERYETSPPQAVAAHNILEAIRALGEKG